MPDVARKPRCTFLARVRPWYRSVRDQFRLRKKSGQEIDIPFHGNSETQSGGTPYRRRQGTLEFILKHLPSNFQNAAM
jgi:hypothetical protein